MVSNVKTGTALAIGAMLYAGMAAPCCAESTSGNDQSAPLGIALEGWPYPYPVSFFSVVVDGQPCRMAFMDVAPTGMANGRTAVLMHGKNFSSDYWTDVIAVLAASGNRVVVPDQIGFNKSCKPDFAYTFEALSAHTLALLNSIGVLGPIDLIGHSTGGMLAVRFALLHPDRVRKLVLEDPIGLEDYSVKIPAQTTETLAVAERRQTVESYRAFMGRYFVSYPKDKQEIFVDQRMRIALSGEFERWALSAAETYQMIYRQPVRSEYKFLAMPVLIIVGAEDRTIVMKSYGDPARVADMGDFPVLAKAACAEVRDCRTLVVKDSGHVPHLEQPAIVLRGIDDFLR